MWCVYYINMHQKNPSWNSHLFFLNYRSIRGMMAVIEDLDHVGSSLNASELKIPFSDTVKYCILAISVILLLVALCILTWQIIRCFSNSHSTYTQETSKKRVLYNKADLIGIGWLNLFSPFLVNSDLLYSEEKPAAAENYSAPPGMKVRGTFLKHWSQIEKGLAFCQATAENKNVLNLSCLCT